MTLVKVKVTHTKKYLSKSLKVSDIKCTYSK